MNTFRSKVVPDLPGLRQYMEEMKRNFCPFLEPSETRSLTSHSVYELASTDTAKIQELMFCLGMLHTEILRRNRRSVPLQQRSLVCENIFFRFQSENIVDGEELFGWPHWLLKTRYTRVGVMFGKFWKGEKSLSRNSVLIPSPPYHMLSIRGSVKKFDPVFFTKAPELLDTLIAAEDTGENVFDDIRKSDELYRLIECSGETTNELLMTCKSILRSHNLYQRLYEKETQKMRKR